MAQIKALIKVSEFCRQTILHNCTNNGLTGLAWWTDRSGKRREYWDGSYDDDKQGCYCYLHGVGCVADVHGESVSLFILVTDIY